MRTNFAIVLVGASMIGACASDPAVPVEVVNAAAFRDMSPAPDDSGVAELEAGEATEGERVSLIAQPPGAVEMVVISPAQARGNVVDPGGDGGPQVGVSSGGPVLAVTPGTTVLIDAKVGDINGRAIYADDFLREFEARFIQESLEYDTVTWLIRMSHEIDRKIDGLLREELLLAEALATIPAEQRQVGLSAALKRMQGRLISRNRGSATLADRRILEELGMSRDEFLKSVQNDQLTNMIIEMEVKGRVNISWREIVQEYNRSIDVFIQEPKAFFRMIRVSTDDTASVSEIARQLDAGVPFEEVASLEFNRFNPQDGGQMTPEKIETTIEALQVFRDERLNTAAVSLQPGEFAGPFQTETSSGQFENWVYLDRILEIKVPLYDAQLAIAERRESEETNIEFDRYISRLLRGASRTDRDQMKSRLMRIAVERFNPEALPVYLQAALHR